MVNGIENSRKIKDADMTTSVIRWFCGSAIYP